MFRNTLVQIALPGLLLGSHEVPRGAWHSARNLVQVSANNRMTPATSNTNAVLKFAKALACPHCSFAVETTAKFCGNCGIVTRYPELTGNQPDSSKPQAAQSAKPNQPVVRQASNSPSNSSGAAVSPSNTGHRVPQFAQPGTGKRVQIPAQLTEELAALMTVLLRERIFLFVHCGLFLCANLFGFSLSIQAYTGFLGDEVSKLVISLTPLMFINSLGLLLLVPINGTKREIARVKEKIQYARFRIEYFHHQL